MSYGWLIPGKTKSKSTPAKVEGFSTFLLATFLAVQNTIKFTRTTTKKELLKK